MTEAESTNEGCHRGRAVAVLLVLAATATSIALLPATASAAECDADYCTERTTNSNGVYILVIPAGGIALVPGGSAFADCKWNVKADFGDGSEPEELEFDAAKEFRSSHKFPEPGIYYVDIHASNGVHAGDLTKCPDLHIRAKVTYPEPPPEETEEPGPEGPGAQAPGGGDAVVAIQPPVAAAGPTPQPSPYWRACGGGVRAHLVACRRAKQVLRTARALLSGARLEQGATFRAAGFSCRARANGDLACRRGQRRVLGT